MKQSKLMKALTIHRKIQQLKKHKPSSRFVDWERRTDWKLKQQEIEKARSPRFRHIALMTGLLSMPYILKEPRQ